MANNQITPFQLTDQFTMDNFNQRINETNTALQNKAPAGYGYGEKIHCYNFTANFSEFTSKLDAIIANMTNDETKQILIYDASLSYTQTMCTARLLCNEGGNEAILTTDFDIRGQSMVYRKKNGIWQPPEYINPPMELNKEYRTTERYLGKPVYVKLLDCGLLVKGTLTYPHGISDIDVCVRYSGVASTSTGVFSGKGALPSFTTPSALNSEWNIFVQNFGTTNIDIYNGGGLTGCPVYVTVWYTKTTD